MIIVRTITLIAVGVILLAASTQSPVAVVEDVTGNPAGIQFMDYVVPGKVIELGREETIVLGYLKSCWRETITGGTVTVGTEQSEVQAGHVERAKVACEGSKMLLTAELANKSAAMVFRDRPRKTQQAPARPQFTLYGLSPVIEIRAGTTLTIERIDKPGERHTVAVGSQQLVHGAFFDLAKANLVLAAGGIYRAQAGTQEMVFKIDADAKPGPTPIVGRLLKLQPAS
jgi:hypothetical protein